MALTDLGPVPSGSTIPIMWTSHDAATGANETMSGLAVGDVLIYKGTSMTQRSSTAGIVLIDTDGLDIDSLTGVNGFSIDLSDNTDAGFYAVGSYYNVICGPVTIDAQTVYIHVATFRIVAAEHTAGYPVATIKDGTGTGEIDTTSGGVLVSAIAAGAITAAAIATDAIDDDAIATGAIASTAFAAGAITATVIATGAIDADALAADAVTEIAAGLPTAAGIADAVWDEDATAHQTGGTFGQAIGDPGASTETLFKAIITDPAGTNIAADVIAIKAETAGLVTSVDALPTNAELATALGTADDAVLAAIAALNNLSSSAAATAVLTTQMTEAYAADGAAPTLAQALHLIIAVLTEMTYSGTTGTAKKLDGSTTAATFTLDDGTNPTSITRAT